MFCEGRTRSITSSPTPIYEQFQVSSASLVLSPSPPNQSSSVSLSNLGVYMKWVLSVLYLCYCHVLGDSRDRFALRSRFVSVARYKFSARLRGLLLLQDLNLCNPDYLTPTLDGFQWLVYVLMFVSLSGDGKKIWSNPSYSVQKDIPSAVPSKAATRDLETKTATTHSSRSPSSSSITITVTTSPTPRQPDLL